jgi:hypothetical protein
MEDHLQTTAGNILKRHCTEKDELEDYCRNDYAIAFIPFCKVCLRDLYIPKTKTCNTGYHNDDEW